MTSEALTRKLLARAEAARGLNAFISLDVEQAIAEARAADAATGSKGPLHGVPIVVKDNINSASLPTTGGTPSLRDFRPAENAPVLQKLLDAGAILLGKTNLHELAFGITSNNAGYGAVGNAYDPSRFAGGSNGGTGAAIGAGIAPAGLGTDTGGSVRIPAALNGIAGLRPTVGRYPNLGIMPISHTRDTAGPMARTVDDLVLLDGIISDGPASLKPTSLEGVRLGLPKPFVDDLDAETRFSKRWSKSSRQPGLLVPLDLGNVSELNAKAGGAIAIWEIKRDLGALAAHGSELTVESSAEIASPDVKAIFDNIVLGKDAISDDAYAAAIGELRPRLQLAYLTAFRNHRLTAILFPTTPLPAQPIQGSDEEVTLNGEKVPTFATFIRNSDPGSVAGLPGLTIPAGLTASGLPVGVELDGLPFTDRALLSIGLALEQLLGPLPRPGSQGSRQEQSPILAER